MKTKRTLSLLLAIVMIVVTMAVPASAALASRWVNEFKTFPQLSKATGDSKPGYTSFLQRFLMCHNSDLASKLGNNPVDGDYGNKTYNAVYSYQVLKDISPDGVAGINTWTKVAGDLTVTANNSQRYIISGELGKVLWVDKVTYSTYAYLYYNGSGTLSSEFHTE